VLKKVYLHGNDRCLSKCFIVDVIIWYNLEDFNTKMAQKPKRGSPISEEQKKMLIDYLDAHPDLKTGKFSSKFTHQDSMKLWQDIGVHLNSIPGSRKDWKDWRKVGPHAFSV
jgi:hypothetical protein